MGSETMAHSHKVKVLEHCRISPLLPPISTVRSSALPLTFFDLVFLPFPPVQRLFFYDYPHPTSHFLTSDLPKLKHSLAAALGQFYPLAGRLITTQKPAIHCSDNDAVQFTVAVHGDDFHDLSSDRPRDVRRFRPLVPALHESAVLAVQVTVFPEAGVAVGTTLRHAAGDGSTYTHFMKTWASLCANVAVSNFAPPCYDRGLVRDPRGLERAFLKELEARQDDESLSAWDLTARDGVAVVRGTFVVGPRQLEGLGRKVAAKCSPYALACGHVWACLVRARGESGLGTERFGFVTGCRPRVDPKLPAAYFGNCLGICCVEAGRRELVGEGGAAVAAAAIWRVIRALEEDGGAFKAAESWVRDVYRYASLKALTVAGSPKLGIYKVDFGWGRPRKVELLSIERTGAMSLAESREGDGGIEIGLALPVDEMEEFSSHFVEGLSGFSQTFKQWVEI